MPRWPDYERETTADLWEELRLDDSPRPPSPPKPTEGYAALLPLRVFHSDAGQLSLAYALLEMSRDAQD